MSSPFARHEKHEERSGTRKKAEGWGGGTSNKQFTYKFRRSTEIPHHQMMVKVSPFSSVISIILLRTFAFAQSLSFTANVLGHGRQLHRGKEQHNLQLLNADGAEKFDDFDDSGRSQERPSDGDGLSDMDLLMELKQRKDELDLGIGKQYVVRTTRGFLNVHSDPSDPFNVGNIVDQLVDGDIVTSVGPNEGDWVHHDRGGWSISKYSGFVWLQQIDS